MRKVFILIALIAVFFVFFSLNAFAQNFSFSAIHAINNYYWHYTDNSLDKQNFSFSAFFADVCGDNICGPTENSCTCAMDCGTCSGLVPGELCKRYVCSAQNTCIKEIIYGCCGNEICEGGENYGSCPSDCEPTELTITMLSPKESQEFYRGELLLVKASLTSHGRSAAGSDVNISGFFGSDVLYNDGRHEDEKLNDMIYANSFFLPKEMTEGSHQIFISARFHSVDKNAFVEFKINPLLSMDVSVNDVYALGDIINVSGKVSKRNEGIKMALNAEIFFEGKTIYEKTINSDDNGNFSFSFHSSLIDPLGDWLLTITGNDDFNNIASYSKSISIIKAVTEKFLDIQLISSMKEKYSRTETINVIASITDSKKKEVSDANVILILPLQEQIQLIETNPGQYAASFRLPENFPLGKQNFLIKASIMNEGILREGSKAFDITVEPTTISIDLLEPSKKRYLVGENLLLKVVLEYPSGNLVDNATVKAIVNEKIIELKQVESGVYFAVLQLKEEDTGALKLKMLVQDAYNNYAEASERIEVSGKTIFVLLQENILIVLFLVIILIAVSFFVYRRISLRFSFDNLQARKLELIELEKELQEKYFKQNAISKEDYDKTFANYENELQLINEKLAALKQKVKK